MEKIVVIDESKLERDLIKRVIEKCGFEVIVLESTVDCVPAIERESPALIFIDLTTSSGTGIDALKLIRERWSQIELPVIMVTGMSDECDVVEYLRQGANDFVTKPVDYEITQIRIQNQLNLARSSKISGMLLNVLPVGVVIIDPATRLIESVNEYALEMFGGDADALVGKRCHTLLCPAEEHACPVCDLGKDIDNTERVMVCANGSQLPVLKTVKKMTLSGQQRLLECFIDISASKKSEQEKVQMQSQVSHSQRLASIGELAAGVGHEINNPLAIICGFVEILESQLEGNAETAKPIGAIKSAAARIRNIVNGLRTFARADTDHVGPMDMHRAISDTADLVESIYAKEGVKIQRKLLASNGNVSGNIGKVQQVVMNLLSNARDAIVPNSGTITLETSLVENDTMFLFRCVDTGMGVAKENLQRIFDSYFTTKDPGKGTGLGLSICNSIVASMGGRIYAESSLGVGTQFSVLVPSSLAVSSEAPIDKTSVKVSANAFLGKVVLVVDDEESIRELMRVSLERLGFSVDDACNGEVALQMISKINYDLVITDLKMPILSGEDFLIKVRSTGNTIPVIVTTGGIITEFSNERRAAIRKMASGYLKKPFANDELVEAITSSMRSR